MRFLSTRGSAPPASLRDALDRGLAPDGGLYVPERIDRWTDDALTSLATLSLTKIGERVLAPFVEGELDRQALAAVVRGALTFPIPLVEIQPDIYALELFHGPTLAFKDVGARVMAQLVAALHDGGDSLTILVATSGDTGGAVASAFNGVRHTRVVILYPDGRISPTQEAQVVRFNAERSNVRAFAVAGSFDDCQRLVKEAFADARLREGVRLTSANSINVGRLLPQMIYYFHAAARLAVRGSRAPVTVSTPSGNFGNLTAGLMARRAGAPIARFVAATNANDVVPAFLESGRFEPRTSIATLSNAMDVGNPSNFERMLWLYNGQVEAMRRDVAGSRSDDGDVRATIRRVFEERGYLLDPHSAIGYLGAASQSGTRVFLATAHPAKFSEVVEPIVGRPIEKPPALVEALSATPRVVKIEATIEALRRELTA